MRYTLGSPISARLNPCDGFTVRISEDARRTVVFFGTPSADEQGVIEYGGTGFLVSYPEEGIRFGYLITARHVAERVQPENGVIVRINDMQGGSQPIEIDSIYWAYHPDKTVDVAASPCLIDDKQFDVRYYDLEDHVKRDAHEFRVRCGDPINVVGLFRFHPGSQRNVPIVHSGNIAILPDPKEKISIKDRTTNKRRDVEGYLIEAQTFEGLSGAPVFQREMLELPNYPKKNGSGPAVFSGVQLLGVYQGAWDGEASELVAKDRKWKGDRRVPIGMGIVVPGERVWELIVNHRELKKRRSEILEQRKLRGAAVTDSVLPDAQPTDENPKHQEDFTRLVGVAARKPPQGEKT